METITAAEARDMRAADKQFAQVARDWVKLPRQERERRLALAKQKLEYRMKNKNVWCRMAALVALCAMLTGCAGILKNPVTTELAADHAAYDTTVLLLNDHPEWKPHFEKAVVDLKFLELQPSFSVGTLLEILRRLPVQKIQGPEALIAFDGAVLIVQIAGNPELTPTSQEALRIVARGLRMGVERRLAELAAPVKASRKVKAK